MDAGASGRKVVHECCGSKNKNHKRSCEDSNAGTCEGCGSKKWTDHAKDCPKHNGSLPPDDEAEEEKSPAKASKAATWKCVDCDVVVRSPDKPEKCGVCKGRAFVET